MGRLRGHEVSEGGETGDVHTGTEVFDVAETPRPRLESKR